MQVVLNILMLSIIEVTYLFGFVIIAGFLLGQIQAVSNKWAYQAFGRRGILLTACIGTPIHEIGHAVMCLLFGHKINAIKLLTMNPQNSTLGYVNHSFNKHSLYQVIGNFFISLGPIGSGTAAILFYMYMLEPAAFSALQQHIIAASVDHITIADFISRSTQSIIIVYDELINGENIFSLNFWIFVWLAMCTSSHIALSEADIKQGISGLMVIFLVTVLVNVGAALFGIPILQYVLTAAKYNLYAVAVLSVSVAFSLLTALIMGSCCGIKRFITDKC